MSDSAIEFSIGGNNQGLVKVLSDSEKQVARSTAQMNREFAKVGGEEGFEKMLASERKVKNNVAQLTQTILSGASAGQILTASMVHVAESFKIGLGASVGIAFADRVYESLSEAVDKAKELQEKMEVLGKPSGGAGNADFASTDSIDKRISELEAFRKENLDTATGGQIYKETIGTNIENIWKNWTEGTPAIQESPQDIVDKYDARNKETNEHLEEEKKKRAEKYTIGVEARQKESEGDKVGADIGRINSGFNELTGQFRGNPDMLSAIERDRKIALAERTRVGNLTASEQSNRVSASDISATESQLAINRTPEEIQRGRLNANVANASTNLQQAIEAGKGKEADQTLSGNIQVALNERLKAEAELEKFNKDTLRDKTQEIDLQRAKNDALDAELAGHSELAKKIMDEAESQDRQNKLIQAGKTDLAEMVRLADQRNSAEAQFDSLWDPNKHGKGEGGQKSSAQIIAQRRAEVREAEKKRVAESHLESNAGLLNVKRDSDGNVVGGFDPGTGQRTERDPVTGDIYSVDKNGKRNGKVRGSSTGSSGAEMRGSLHDQTNPDNGFLDQFKQRGISAAENEVTTPNQPKPEATKPGDQGGNSMAQMATNIATIAAVINSWSAAK